MIKKFIIAFFMLNLFCIAYAGEPDIDIAFPQDIKSEKEEVKKVIEEGDPIIENLLEAIRKTDYEKYVKDFTVALKNSHWDKKLYKKNNKNRIKRVGKPVSYTIKKAEKQNPFYVLYYDVTVKKSDKPMGIRMVLRRDKDSRLDPCRAKLGGDG